nr:group 3 secretory phospholipase A2 isoform X2 [Nothobranchius furzeri]
MESWLLTTVFVLSSIFLSKTEDVTRLDFSCLRLSHTDGQTLVTFLRKDAAGARFLLYLTRWTEDSRFIACDIHPHPSVTEGYRAFCDKNQTQDQEIQKRFNLSALLHPEAPCALTPSRAPEGTERGARMKRSWIFPGTLWCGSGSKAAGYEQLGMFERADRCCREHDHCSRIIPAFTVNYGVFNPNVFTVSHCECDQRFRQCLLGMNDSISGMVGYSFFNILKVPCFELKQLKRCTQMYWWGMCKVAKLAPYAVFRSPLPYNSSEVSSDYMQTDSRNSTSSKHRHLSKAQRKPAKSRHRCGLKEPPRGDGFDCRRTKGRSYEKQQKITKLEPSHVHTTPITHTTTQREKTATVRIERRRTGKKKGRRKGFAGLVQKNNISLTSPGPHTSFTTSSRIPPSTQRLKLRPNAKAAAKEATKYTKRNKKIQNQGGSSIPVKNNNPLLHCANCLEQETLHTTTGSQVKTKESPFSLMKNKSIQIKKTTEVHKKTAESLSTTTKTRLKPSACFLKDCQKGLGVYLLSNKTTQQLLGGNTKAGDLKPKERSINNNQLHELTDNQLQCRGLTHLDDCKFKIPPLEKKYNLQNMDSKTAYHCDCTSQLAVQIENLKKASIPPSLLVDFVSQQCFTLPKETKYVLKASLKPLTYIEHLRS